MDNNNQPDTSKEIIVKVNAANVFALNAKKTLHEKLANLPEDDQDFLAKLIDSEKAMNSFRKNRGILRTMFGIK